MLPRAAMGALALLAVGALVPLPALAHGLVQRADLPIPEWLFGWAAGIVLVVSFVALAVLWPRPRLEEPRWRPLPGGIGRALGSRAVEVACGAIGVALLAVVVSTALLGPKGQASNLAPTFVYIVFWVGLVFVSVVFGDVFRAFNPWRALGRATGWVATRLRRGRPVPRRPYPEWLGRWPAAITLLGFACMELAFRDWLEPRRVGIAVLAYTAVTFAGMARFGTEPWISRGEGFSVYFNLFSRVAPFEQRDRVVGVRPLLSGLPRLEPAAGTVGLLAVMIGTVTFDGFSQGSIWKDVQPDVANAFETLGASLQTAVELADTAGIVAAVLVVAAFYRLGIAGARSVGGDLGADRLRMGFVHSLVPIAVVYVAAHYLTALVFQGQAIKYLASDPFGEGWDLFGTAESAIDYGVLSQNGTWYLQVGFVVTGHVAALVLAHDRALALYRQARLAVRSQYWMLGIMVGFTTLALWLLAQANA